MSETKERQSIILFCHGGAGDVLAATPMIRGFRKKYPDDEIVVLCTYSTILENNKNIDQVVGLNDVGGLYEKYVINNKNRVRFYKKHFIYDSFLDTPRQESKCLPELVCKIYGSDYDGAPLDYVVTPQERKQAEFFMAQFKKPVVLLHANCSIPSDGNMQKVHFHKDLNHETIVPLIEKYKNDFDFMQIGLVGEKLVPGALDGLGMKLREVINLIPLAKTYILIESIFAHASNALGGHGVVVCNNMDAEFFGHPNNINIGFGNNCAIYPCNRPVGALADSEEWFINPKTRERPLWACKNQLCNKIPFETLEQAFLTTLKNLDAIKTSAPTLQQARNS